MIIRWRKGTIGTIAPVNIKFKIFLSAQCETWWLSDKSRISRRSLSSHSNAPTRSMLPTSRSADNFLKSYPNLMKMRAEQNRNGHKSQLGSNWIRLNSPPSLWDVSVKLNGRAFPSLQSLGLGVDWPLGRSQLPNGLAIHTHSTTIPL
jgi:hypothetical protein